MLTEHVFRPSAFPEYMDVSQRSNNIGIEINYEMSLRQALKISGCLTSIVGPSKVGKSVLCERVVDLDHLVEVSGVDFMDYQQFWQIVVLNSALPMSVQSSARNEVRAGDTSQMHQSTEQFVLQKDRVIQYFKENQKVLVIDDLHYAPEESQLYIAQ